MINPVAEIITALVSPTNKLIDVISKGIGVMYEPHKIKKIADAEAYKIKTIGQAISENGDLPMKYADNCLSVNSSDIEELQKRAMYRFVRIETQRQFNIENIADKAYDLLDGKKQKSTESVSSDWVSRFITSAQDISEESIQQLWAKILAGEVLQPKTFSIRTLDILKNMSKQDAELFTKICPFIINGKSLPNEIELLNKYGVTYGEIMKLDECGLINSSGLISRKISITEVGAIIFSNERLVCLASKIGNFQVQVFTLTASAIELQSIVKCDSNDKYLIEYANKLKTKNVNLEISLHRIKIINGNSINYEKKDLLITDNKGG